MTQLSFQSRFITGVVIILFYSTLGLSQIHVDSLKDVGIGTSNPDGAKLKIVTTDESRALHIYNHSPDSVNKYGLYNVVDSIGTGTKHGIFNDVRQQESSGNTIYGFVNDIETHGAGEAYGFSSIVRALGTGNKYGFSNRVYHTPSATGEMRGIYNYYNTGGTGRVYGIYNEGRINNPALNHITGIRNFMVQASGVDDKNILGIENDIILSDSISEGFVYGVRSVIGPRGEVEKYGIYSQVKGDTTSGKPIYGMYSDVYAEGDTASIYGIYSRASTTDSTTGYGIYAHVKGANASNSWAGYFSGNVYSTYGVWQGSDRDLKENIHDFTKGLELVEHLRPVTFNYRTDFTEGVPREKQYGFIAQEIEEFLPELVKDVTAPGQPLYRTETEEVGDEEEGIYQVTTTYAMGEKPPTKNKAVNYTALIPILVKAIQELEEEIEVHKKMVNSQQLEIEIQARTIAMQAQDIDALKSQLLIQNNLISDLTRRIEAVGKR